ncbi:hypothetical protein [Domibacillus indicus]
MDDYISAKNYPPSIREIDDAVELTREELPSTNMTLY